MTHLSLLVVALLALAPVLGDSVQRDVKIAVAPRYGGIARTGAVNGEVSIKVSVAKNGVVLKIKSIKGPPALQKDALDAVRRWVFEPYKEETEQEINMVFEILSRDRPESDEGVTYIRPASFHIKARLPDPSVNWAQPTERK